MLKLITSQNINILDLNNSRIGYGSFSKFGTETMKTVPVLYQSGCLTITGYDEKTSRFTLDYPNVEVSACFAKPLFKVGVEFDREQRNIGVWEARKALD